MEIIKDDDKNKIAKIDWISQISFVYSRHE